MQPTERLPAIIHQVWIGPRERPVDWMRTWIDQHPDWTYKLWDNDACRASSFRCQRQIDAASEWCGKADIIRYEILEREGGIYVDADSECLLPLDDEFLSHEWASYEHETVRPGLITNAFLGMRPGSPLMRALVDDISSGKKRLRGPPWMTTGPMLLTRTIEQLDYDLHIYPSRVFMPNHFSGKPNVGQATSRALHHWMSTRGRPQGRRRGFPSPS